MTNPWEDISLDDYENHMSLESVKQLQTMNSIMKDQFNDFPVETAMVLGIAGGNGLEYVSKEKFKKVYGIDVNQEYLNVVLKRYSDLSDILECIRVDLTKDYSKLPKSRTVIANLLIEYIGYKTFQNVILQVEPEYVSCVIQINRDDKNWVSDSPYLHAFDRLDEVHCQMDERELEKNMRAIGYRKTIRQDYDLPDRKLFIRIDFYHVR